MYASPAGPLKDTIEPFVCAALMPAVKATLAAAAAASSFLMRVIILLLIQNGGRYGHDLQLQQRLSNAYSKNIQYEYIESIMNKYGILNELNLWHG